MDLGECIIISLSFVLNVHNILARRNVMELYYIICDASGNTTALIKSPLSRELYVTAATIIRKKLGIEQVGFLEKKVSGNYHLEMMRGEFCGRTLRPHQRRGTV
jgi:hypothetical protein